MGTLDLVYLGRHIIFKKTPHGLSVKLGAFLADEVIIALACSKDVLS